MRLTTLPIRPEVRLTRVREIAFVLLGVLGASCNSSSTKSLDQSDTGSGSVTTDLGAPLRDLGPADAGVSGELPSGGPLIVGPGPGRPGSPVIDCSEDPGSEAGQMRADMRLEARIEPGAEIPEGIRMLESFDLLRQADFVELGSVPFDLGNGSQNISEGLRERGAWPFRLSLPEPETEPMGDLVQELRDFCREFPLPNNLLFRFTFESDDGTFPEYMRERLVCANCDL